MMNNLPLQPLVFGKHNIATSPFYEYQSHPDTESKGKWMVKIAPLNSKKADEPARGFATKQDAQDWVNSTHYPHTMQPYVKPLPTWIDVSERLPEVEDFYLVYVFDGHREANVVDILYWNADHQQFLEWDFMNNVTHWMPLPSPPEGGIG